MVWPATTLMISTTRCRSSSSRRTLTKRSTACRTRSQLNLSHSSFLRTMQEIFGVGPFLGDAANADDLADLFKPGSLAKLKTTN